MCCRTFPPSGRFFARRPGQKDVVLFSDARFDLPASAPPTYVVIDPLLESPADAAIASLQVRGRDVVVDVTNTSGPRRLTMGGAINSAPTGAIAGSYALTRQIDPSASRVSAGLSSGDAWPENDQLVAIPPPADQRQRWWVGTSPPAGDWRVMLPSQLPSESAEYLAASVIVLQNVSATDISPLQQQRLQQYVRDLGGGLVILGGDHAFAAGAYPGSALEALSPLASTALPWPTTHWILLADSSGSMNQMQGGVSLWHQATDAIVKVIPHLPPDDSVSTGGFAEGLTWWTTGTSLRQTISVPLPPENITPHGPTNLEDAILEIARGLEDEGPKQLMLLTDADAEIKDPAGLEAALRKKNIRLHLLAIENGSALPILRPIVRNTNGTIVKQLDPQKWADAVQTLMRDAAPKLLGREPLPVHFQGDLATFAPLQAMPWNRTWLKDAATLLGQGTEDGKPIPAVARWNVGEGRVLALAFDSGNRAAEMLAASVGRPPHDPRYQVSWETGPRLRVSVDAVEGATYLNGKSVRLELSQEADTSSAITSREVPQTGPGRYELELPAPRSPTFGAIRVDGHLVDRVAIAGRYAPEFDAIGNDHEAMQQLAHQTGGQVIAPRQIWPIDFRWPGKAMDLTSILCNFGRHLCWRRG